VTLSAIISRDDFREVGFAVIPKVLTASSCEAIVDRITKPDSITSRRALLSEPRCRELAVSLRDHPALSQSVLADTVAVQCTLFEKSPERNWLVALHQDLSIPVKQHVQHDALTGWSMKAGGLFVQPPDSVLESLVAVRLHLDDYAPAAGALRLVPASHEFGRVSSKRAGEIRAELGEIEPPVYKGDVPTIGAPSHRKSTKACYEIPILPGRIKSQRNTAKSSGLALWSACIACFVRLSR
jgi:Phytanoyl-CoA dioxygenase (PhyH)